MFRPHNDSTRYLEKAELMISQVGDIAPSLQNDELRVVVAAINSLGAVVLSCSRAIVNEIASLQEDREG